MERRKIQYNWENGKYEVLKPCEGSNGWYEDGKKLTIHGLDDLLKRNEFSFEMSGEIRKIIEMYRTDKEERKRKYSPNN